MCSAPKTGTTSWTNYYLFVNEGISLTKTEQKDSKNVYLLYGGRLSPSFLGNVNTADEEISALLRKVDRIVISQNPYTRFISSYLDWLGRVDKIQAEVQFPEFVKLYKARTFSAFRAFPITHINPLSKFVNFHKLVIWY